MIRIWTCCLICLSLLIPDGELRGEGKIRVLLIDGQNNHNWVETSESLRGALERAGLFQVATATSPPQEAEPGAWRRWWPDFRAFDVVVSNYNGQPWPRAVQGGVGGVRPLRRGLGDRPRRQQRLYRMDRVQPDDRLGMAGPGLRRRHRPRRRQRAAPAYRRRFRHRRRTRAAAFLPGPDPETGASHHEGNSGPLDACHRRAVPRPAGTRLGHDGSGFRLFRPEAIRVRPARAPGLGDPLRPGPGRHQPEGHHWPGQEHRNSLHCVGFQTIFTRSVEWLAKDRVTLPVPDRFPTTTEVVMVDLTPAPGPEVPGGAPVALQPENGE